MGKGGISPEYFLYKMEWWEAQAFMDGLAMRDRNAWSTARWIGWIISRANGGKIDTPEDMIQFPWEKEPELTEEEQEEERKAMAALLNSCIEDNKKTFQN